MSRYTKYRGDAVIFTGSVLRHKKITDQFVKVLKEHNLYANTIIIITSDNGGIPGSRAKFGYYGRKNP